MSKVLDQHRFGKYIALKLDSIPSRLYNTAKIGGDTLKVFPVFDMGEAIAIEYTADKNYIGAEVIPA